MKPLKELDRDMFVTRFNSSGSLYHVDYDESELERLRQELELDEPSPAHEPALVVADYGQLDWGGL